MKNRGEPSQLASCPATSVVMFPPIVPLSTQARERRNVAGFCFHRHEAEEFTDNLPQGTEIAGGEGSFAASDQQIEAPAVNGLRALATKPVELGREEFGLGHKSPPADGVDGLDRAAGDLQAAVADRLLRRCAVTGDFRHVAGRQQ